MSLPDVHATFKLILCCAVHLVQPSSPDLHGMSSVCSILLIRPYPHLQHASDLPQH